MAKVERKSTETNAVAEVEVQDSAVGAEEPAKFEVGKTYFVDMGNDIYRYFKVVSRKGKEITVESNDGGVYESKVGRILPRNIHGNFETAKGIMMSELVHACDEVNAEFLKAEEERKAREYAKLLEECAEDEEFEETEEGELEMATTKFEVGKVYITMADKFGDGEQTGKSVVIERTEGTVTFKHLASGEIFVREVQVFDAVQVEGRDGLDAMDNFIADNFGEEITTADIEPIEQVAEIESVENTVESVESAVETTDSTAEPEQAKVEVCKAYDAKDIIAACYSVEIAEIDAEEKPDAVDIAVDAEIETARKNYPMRLEIYAVVAAIAEKHGFKLDLSKSYFDVYAIKTPKDFSISIRLEKNIYDRLAGLDKVTAEYQVKQNCPRTAAELAKLAKDAAQAAEFAKDLEKIDLTCRYTIYNNFEKSNGWIFENGDRAALEKYVEYLDSQIKSTKKDITDDENEYLPAKKQELKTAQEELADLENSGRNNKKVRQQKEELYKKISDLQNESENVPHRIQKYKAQIELMNEEIRKAQAILSPEEVENTPDDSPEIVETLICIEHTRQDILNYKKEVIHSESVIAEGEKLIQLYAEENKTRHKDKSLDWLIEMQQDEIETCRADIAYNKRRIEREEARLANLEEKLAALKVGKVAA